MIINRLTLNNFGIYKGTVEYDFKTTSEKNIILINGKNGSGKTTLLTAFKIALYGPYFLGYKTKVQEYYDFIEKRINAYSLNEGDNTASLTIDFTINEKGLRNRYIIDRSWNLINGTPNENLKIHRNNTLLSPKASLNFIDEIAEMISPDYIDIFFFDGEKIDQLLAKSKNQDYIMAIFSKIFNLDLFEKLKIDLNEYLNQKNIFNQLSETEAKYEEKRQEKNDISKNIRDLEIKKGHMEVEIASLNNQLKHEEKSFKALGGILNEEKHELQKKMTMIQQERERLRSDNKYIIQEFLPFLMLSEELESLKLSFEKERISNDNRIFINKINSKEFKYSLENNSSIKIDELKKVANEAFGIDDSLSLVHDLSYNEEASIINLINEINSYSLSEILDFYDDDKDMLFELSQLNTKLKEGLDDAIDEYTKVISDLKSKIVSIENQVKSIDTELDNKTQHLKLLIAESEKLIAEMKISRKDENSYSLVKAIDIVISEYTTQTRKIKLEQLERSVTDVFKSLIRKEDFINHIKIDFNTEQFKIFNKIGYEIPESNLSAGERQIFVLSILWGLLKISNRKIPIIFDTLLGRLDKTHKENITRHFLHELGEQIIILATDTEIDEDYKTILAPYISIHYEINYSETFSSVVLNTKESIS